MLWPSRRRATVGKNGHGNGNGNGKMVRKACAMSERSRGVTAKRRSPYQGETECECGLRCSVALVVMLVTSTRRACLLMARPPTSRFLKDLTVAFYDVHISPTAIKVGDPVTITGTRKNSRNLALHARSAADRVHHAGRSRPGIRADRARQSTAIPLRLDLRRKGRDLSISRW